VKGLALSRVERLIRDLLGNYGLAASLLTVRHEPPRWQILIRDDTDRMFDLDVPDSLTVRELRAHLEKQLLRGA
jgi:hypothetical protein